MRMFRLFLCVVMLCGAGSVFAEGDVHSQHKNWSGLYLGFVPCPDCKGVKTTLALNPNGTYQLLTQYIGKSEREIVEKGKFEMDSETKTITLTPKKGDIKRHYFMDSNDALIQLDHEGHRITGDGADRYVLRKTDVTQPSSSSNHGSH